MNVPYPCRISTMPSARSARMASRTLSRLAPSRSMSRGSVGIGAPGSSRRSWIRATIRSCTVSPPRLLTPPLAHVPV